jgi:hypothetical protein
MGDSNCTAERLLSQLPRKIVELSFGSTPNQRAMVDRADASAVVPAIFETLQTVEQALSDLTFTDNSNDSAHAPSLSPDDPAVAFLQFGGKLCPFWM